MGTVSGSMELTCTFQLEARLNTWSVARPVTPQFVVLPLQLLFCSVSGCSKPALPCIDV